jgi:hypothetical protein
MEVSTRQLAGSLFLPFLLPILAMDIKESLSCIATRKRLAGVRITVRVAFDVR